LYTKKVRDGLPKYPTASLLKQDISYELLSMFTVFDEALVRQSCSELMTPPTEDQIASSLAMFRHYGMVGPFPFNQLDDPIECAGCSSKFEKVDVDVDRLTPIGLLVYCVSTGAKVSPWNALLVVIAAINGHLDEALKLAVILEELSHDVQAIFKVPDLEPNATKPDIDLPEEFTVSTDDKGLSEHLTLLKILEKATDVEMDGVTFYEKTGMSFAFWTELNKTITGLDGLKKVLLKNIDVLKNHDSISNLKLDEPSLLDVIKRARTYHTATVVGSKCQLPYIDNAIAVKFKRLFKSSAYVDHKDSTQAIIESFVNAGKMMASIVTFF
jgi:hypothetical protein